MLGYWLRIVALGAGVGGYGKGVAGDGVSFHAALDIARRSRQVTFDAAHVGLFVRLVHFVLGGLLMTARTERVCGDRRAGLLCVHLVAGDAGDASLAVPAAAPFGNGALVAGAAELVRFGHGHALAGVFRPVRAMARLAGDAGHDELSGNRVIPCGVAGEALPGLLCLLHVFLKDWIERGLGVGGARPVVELVWVALGALLRALVRTESGAKPARGALSPNAKRPDGQSSVRARVPKMMAAASARISHGLCRRRRTIELCCIVSLEEFAHKRCITFRIGLSGSSYLETTKS